MTFLPYRNRESAGRLLAIEVLRLKPENPVVYALPRGGVPVAVPIAEALGAPLDVLLVRKIAAPGQPELAAASVVDGERPDIILNHEVMRAAGLTEADINAAAKLHLTEIERRRTLYTPGRTAVAAQGRTGILVDDGIATGASMRAAIAAVRRRKPLRIVVAAPVAASDTAAELRKDVDIVICLATPKHFGAVSSFYQDFHQLDDAEVVALLERYGQTH